MKGNIHHTHRYGAATVSTVCGSKALLSESGPFASRFPLTLRMVTCEFVESMATLPCAARCCSSSLSKDFVLVLVLVLVLPVTLVRRG